MPLRPLCYSVFCGLALFGGGELRANVVLPALISDHMVLAKSSKVPIWGSADVGEEVSVTLNGQSVKTRADEKGQWTGVLDLKNSPPGPFIMEIAGKDRHLIKDVVVGEVWVAGGQSNMEFVLNRSAGAAAEIAQSSNPMLRQFKVATAHPLDEVKNCKGEWVVAGPETAGNFTAVGYYFGKILQKELSVPVGIISSNLGGTPCEHWISREGIASDPELAESYHRGQTAFEEYPAKRNAYIQEFQTWVEQNKRQDRFVAETAVQFAASDINAEDWVPVKLPGVISGTGLPGNGAIWLRREITIPAPAGGKSLTLDLGAFNGFDTVYWNGALVHQTTEKNDPGPEAILQVGIPDKLVKEGKNVVVLRIYSPAIPFQFSKSPKIGSIPWDGQWLAKAEFALPAFEPDKQASVPKSPGKQLFPPQTSTLFNGMISPLLFYAITGVIWYQGESNAERAWQYRKTFPLLIGDWRKQWNQGEFPFYFCQLAGYGAKSTKPEEGGGWAELREAQNVALRLPNTGEAVLVDIGEAGDIHPKNKKTAGERLASVALARSYGRNIPCSGPVYESMKIEAGRIRLGFTHCDGGLVAQPQADTYVVRSETGETAPLIRNSPGSEIEGFSICGADRKWVWAKACIDGEAVIVWAEAVPDPIAVRYAWAANPVCNLFDGAGFPASPFRTDNFPVTTLDKKY